MVLGKIHDSFDRVFKSKDELNLTDEPVTKNLFFLSLPIIMMNLLQTAYNIADTFWLGQLSDVALPAITFAFPLVFFLISLGIGLITFTFAYPIAAVFTKSPEVAAVAAKFLRYVSSSFRFIGILRAYTGSFRGTGATISAAIISLGALGAIKLPIA